MAEAKGKALSGAELLQLLACETELFDFGGGVVEIRTLTFPEAQGAFTGGDANDVARHALRLGLVSPQLSDEEFDRLWTGKAGPVMKMAQRVMEISGLSDKEGAPPLAGDGSLPTPAA